jgi:hypothetical protein
MQYELVSRALAYVSCFSTMSLFMTSVAIAAMNVGKVPPLLACPSHACVSGITVASSEPFGGLNNRSQIDALAARFWKANI